MGNLKSYNVLTLILLSVLLLSWQGTAYSESQYEKYYSKYPLNKFVVGIGYIDKTGRTYADKRVSELMARRDIATQIRVKVTEVTIDKMCYGAPEKSGCMNFLSSVLESHVNEFLTGSRIVDSFEQEGMVYAVAVMPKSAAIEQLRVRSREAANETKSMIQKAKSGDSEAIKDAKGELLKAKALNSQSRRLNNESDSSSRELKKLGDEIKKLESRGSN